jgi:hypothetical protein
MWSFRGEIDCSVSPSLPGPSLRLTVVESEGLLRFLSLFARPSRCPGQSRKREGTFRTIFRADCIIGPVGLVFETGSR